MCLTWDVCFSSPWLLSLSGKLGSGYGRLVCSARLQTRSGNVEMGAIGACGVQHGKVAFGSVRWCKGNLKGEWIIPRLVGQLMESKSGPVKRSRSRRGPDL